MKPLPKLGCYLAITMALSHAAAQHIIPVTRLSIREGLSSDVTNPLLTDRQGALWIGYYNGVQRYNGRQFTTFGERDGIEEPQIADLACDTTGIVYVMTVGGMYRYAGGAGPRAFRRCEDEGVGNAVVLDSTHYYIGYGFRPDLYYRSGNTRTRISMNGDTVQTLKTDGAGNVYVSAGNCIYHLHDGQLKDRIPMPHRNAVLWNDGPAVYAHTYGDTVLYRLAGSAATVEMHHRAFAALPVVSYCMALPDAGSWLMMTGTGEILRALPGGRTDTVVALPLNHGRFSDMKRVADGFWASSEYGLYHICTHPGYDTASFIPAYRSNGFGGVGAAPLEPSRVPAAATQKMQALQAAHNLREYYEDSRGNAWTMGYTEMLYTDKNGTSIPYNTSTLPQPPPDGEIRDLIEDRLGHPYLLTENNVVDWHNGQPIPYTPDTIAGGRPVHLFLGTTDTANTLMLATSQGLFAGKDGHYRDLTPELGIQRNTIFDLNPTPDGRVWMNVSVNKLYCVGPAGGGRYHVTDSVAAAWGSYTPAPGDISCDTAGNLWVNYTRELVVFLRLQNGRYSSDSIVTFTGADGLDAFGSSAMHLYPMPDGTMLLQGKHQLLYTPAMLAGRRAAPPPMVAIQSLSLHGHPTDWAAAGYRTNAAGLPTGLSLSHADNYLTIYYSAADLSNGKYLTYRCKLEGLDADWQMPTNDEKAAYNSLPPGNYRFVVQAAGANKRWGPAQEFAFTICPPWWKSVWAYIAYILLVLGGIYLYTNLRIKAERRRALTERLVTEQQLKALRAQINPHFLQNTFEFLSQTLDEQPVERSQQVIVQLSSYLRNVLYRSDENVVTLEDELAFAEEYLAINRLLFHDKFSYRIELGDEVDTFGLKVPSLLLQPLLENALKHGAGGAEIGVRVFAEGFYTSCVISNTIAEGPQRQYPQGYQPKGLALTQARLRLLYPGSAHPATIAARVEDGRYEVTIRIPV